MTLNFCSILNFDFYIISGHSFMQFNMEMSVSYIINGMTVNKKELGGWTAGLKVPIFANSVNEMKEYTAALVFRVVTVVVSAFQIYIHQDSLN